MLLVVFSSANTGSIRVMVRKKKEKYSIFFRYLMMLYYPINSFTGYRKNLAVDLWIESGLMAVFDFELVRGWLIILLRSFQEIVILSIPFYLL